MKNTIVKIVYLFISLFLLTSCSSERTIVHGIREQDANEIIVFLNSKNIESTKVESSEGGGTGPQKAVLWDIQVPENKAMDAMSFLDEEGLPRKHQESLLDIFGSSSLVPSETQERIRYQAGLAQQIANTIKEIDGVIDANVMISFPEENPITGTTSGPITASVYIKHNGILDDPNSQLRSKIRQLVAASVTGLKYDNVTIIGERAAITEQPFRMHSNALQLENIWSIDLAKESVSRFRFIFFSLLFLNLILLFCLIGLIWKLYPILKKFIFSDYLSSKQLDLKQKEHSVVNEDAKKNSEIKKEH
ncbi:type III secretion periplasmic lipoprotein [Parachlamydia acanthamoebae UV-7]|jgi:type III secretion protein J|uniref:Type III secretion periplasmic lipoprotein n=1 Tax=Parachlamydia acanthamoebae (strain UV7) TaxID=765952 RepID=F8L0B8_PARAV|nr:type III secretion inner membrane ring lipoprotein SctJ [Parachlamydia acanthamoebae]CCB86648.1 type III secretion periplasmic lipoprotein [Parachlamydia acanthamoebae UV-7]